MSRNYSPACSRLSRLPDGRELKYIPRVATNKKPEAEYKVGDRVTVILSRGRIVEATVRAVVERTDGVQLQVDYGHDETGLIGLWQIYSPDS